MKNKLYKKAQMIGCIALMLININAFAECKKTIIILRHGEKKVTKSFGQLNCLGENRALALPHVLASKFGKPHTIFACNPTVTSHDGCPPNGCCNHVRPYNTSVPTAVYFSMPVNTTYTNGAVGGPHSPTLPKLKNCTVPPPPTKMLPLPQPPTPAGLCGTGKSSGNVDMARELVRNNEYCGKTVFVLWEHTEIPILIYDLYYVLGLNATNKIPLWPYGACVDSECKPNTCSPDYNFDSIYIVHLNQGSKVPYIDITLDNEGLNGLSEICPT